MKAMITSTAVAIVCIAINVTSLFGASSLHIKVSEFGSYTIEINGHSYVARQNTVALNQIRPGTYRLRIIRNSPKVYDRYGRCAPAQVVYDSRVNVPANAHVTAVYDRFGVKVHRNVIKAPCPPPACTPPPPRNHPTACGMNPYDFDQLIISVRSASFDKTKLSIAQNAVTYNALNTHQIGILMQEFSFDSYKFDFAKCAYNRCLDKQNYYQLTSKFTFDSYGQRLMEYVG